MTYQRHPSKRLNELYAHKSFQGANPETAKFIFVGRDPNWAANVEQQSSFPQIESYLQDGVAFWESKGVHHPFLLPDYKDDGKRFHRMFSNMKLTSEYAKNISFVELLPFPTTGMSGSNRKSFLSYLMSNDNQKHLLKLESYFEDKTKIVFVSPGIITDLRLILKQKQIFKAVQKIETTPKISVDVLRHENIRIHTHFSNAISLSTLDQMRRIIDFE